MQRQPGLLLMDQTYANIGLMNKASGCVTHLHIMSVQEDPPLVVRAQITQPLTNEKSNCVNNCKWSIVCLIYEGNKESLNLVPYTDISEKLHVNTTESFFSAFARDAIQIHGQIAPGERRRRLCKFLCSCMAIGGLHGLAQVCHTPTALQKAPDPSGWVSHPSLVGKCFSSGARLRRLFRGTLFSRRQKTDRCIAKSNER